MEKMPTISTNNKTFTATTSSGGLAKVRVQVYIDTGNVHEYEVASESEGREHAAAIIATGYRSATVNNPKRLTWFPPHRINKVVLLLLESSNTKYFDKIISTQKIKIKVKNSN